MSSTNLQKVKKIFKSAGREEDIPYLQEKKVRITSDFESETMKGGRMQSGIFKMLEEKKKHQPEILYPAKVSFKK